MTTRLRMVASYASGILGYGFGMALSLTGHVPAGLGTVCAGALLALAIFGSSASSWPRAPSVRPD
jgi:hypothetical protein